MLSGTNRGRLPGSGAWLGRAVYSPDGERIVATGWDHLVTVWDASRQTELLTFRKHEGWVRDVAFSPEGDVVVTVSGDNTGKVWNSRNGELILELSGEDKYGVFAVAFSPTGEQIATGHGNGSGILWDARSGKQLRVLLGHNKTIRSLAFSQTDGNRLVTASDDETCIVWDTSTGRKSFVFNRHRKQVMSVAFMGDERIVSGSDDGTVKVWNAFDGSELLTLDDHGEAVEAIAVSPDGRRIAAAGRASHVTIWEAATSAQVDNWVSNREASEQVLVRVEAEQRAAAEKRFEDQRYDDGAVKKWLLLAPIPIASINQTVAYEPAVSVFHQEQVPNEAELAPWEGKREDIGGLGLVWREIQLDDYLIDFNLHAGANTEWCIAYAACYIQSATDRNDVSLMVGSDDQSKVFLNGKQVHSREVSNTYTPDQMITRNLQLEAGTNVLLFKIMNNNNQWEGSIRLAHESGQPLRGIKVTLDPNSQ